MTILTFPRFLRTVLWADAASAAGCAALQLAAAPVLSPLLGLPAPLLLATGVALLPFVAFAIWLARRATPPRAGVQALALANAAWVAGCLALLLTGSGGTVLGQLYILAQAVAVAVLAELQWFGARRAPEPGWA